MTTPYRSWDERAADAQLTRAKAEKVKAEAGTSKAKAETDRLSEEVKQTKLRAKLKAEEQEAGEAERQRKQAQRQAGVDSGARFKRLVTTIIVLGMLASLPGQINYFFGMGRWLLLTVPFFLEVLAWAGVEGTKWAHRKGLARWPFWILTGSLAGFAGFINATKGTAEFGPVAGYVLAAASVVGPLLAEVQQYLESKTAADGRSFEERARDRAEARKRAAEQRAQEKRDAQQDTERRRLFPKEWERYEQILALSPRGSVSRDEAWDEAGRAVLFPGVWALYAKLLAARPGVGEQRAALWGEAWRRAEQMPVGLTAGTLAGEISAQQRIEKVMEEAGRTPEQVAVDLFLADVFGSDGDDGGPTGGGCDADPRKPSGGGQKPSAKNSPNGRISLGGKGKQPSRRTGPKGPEKPLDEADLEKVRRLAEVLGGTHKLSVRNVSEVVGGGRTEYLVRLRNAVQDESSR